MTSDELSLTYNAGKQKYSKFVNISPPSYKSVYIHLYQSKKDGQAHASAVVIFDIRLWQTVIFKLQAKKFYFLL